MNVFLDLNDIARRFLVSSLLKLFNRVFVLSLNPLSVFRHFDLIVVFDLVDLFLQSDALCIPLQQLTLVDTHLAEHLFQAFILIFLFFDFYIAFLKPLLACLLDFADLSILFKLCFMQSAVCILLRFLDLILQLKHQLHIPSVFIGQRLNKHLSVFDLSFELLH